MPYTVEVELEVTSWIFETGHSIRLDLAGSDWPNAWPPPSAATLTFERGGSALILHGVDGQSPITQRPNLAPATKHQERYESAQGNTVDTVAWRIEHDVLDRQTRTPKTPARLRPMASDRGSTSTMEERLRCRPGTRQSGVPTRAPH